MADSAGGGVTTAQKP